MPFLYALTFSNAKQYIGITSNAPSHRFKQHKRRSKHGNTALYAAWRTHGEPTMRVLAIVEERDLAATEIKAISILNTRCPNGYNVSFGGDISPMKNPDVVKKGIVTRRNGSGYTQNIGRKMSPEFCQAASKRMLGKKLSEETKAKVVAAIRSRPPQSKETVEKRKAAVAAWRLTPEGIATVEASAARRVGTKGSQRARDVASFTHKGKVLSEETKRKVSESQKKRLADPKVRAILSAHTSRNRIGVRLSEETKRKIGDFHRQRWEAIRATSRGGADHD
jgi:hypothetical protein